MIDAYIAKIRERVINKLGQYIAGVGEKHPGLADAAAHMLGDGKKIRPALCVAACESVGGSADRALPAACAVEMIHTYSLIHDDLPSMDNDDTRRGMPSTHKKFGEATAILAGDLLLTDSFGFLITEGRAAGLSDSTLVETVGILSDRAGKSGMAVGQMMDLDGGGEKPEVHRLKTGSLIEAAVRCGVLAAGADEKQTQCLSLYAHAVGMAFQAVDDILDSGAPQKQEEVRLKALEFTRRATSGLKDLDGDGSVLTALALMLYGRTG